MQLRDAIQRRRMRRSFSGVPVDEALVREMCEEALRAPTAGNCAGVEMVIVPHGRIAEYFAAATDEQWRLTATRADDLQRAGSVVVVISRPDRYLERYSEPDKARSNLDDANRWPVPYWHTDAAMATMTLLLLLEESGLAASLWGNFRSEQSVLELVGAPSDARLFGSVLLGPHDQRDHRSASLARRTPSRAERVRVLPLH